MSYDPYEFNDADLITEERINSLRAFGLTDANVSASASIAWTKVNKTGSALTDFFAGPTIPLQFIPSGIVDPIVNADISSSANIDWSKINKTGSSLADLGTRTISQITDFPGQTGSSGKVLSTNGSALSWITSPNQFELLGIAVSSGISVNSSSYVDAGPTVTFTATSTKVFGFILGSECNTVTNTTYNSGVMYAGINLNGVDYTVGSIYKSNYTANSKVTLAGGTIISGLTIGQTYTAKMRLVVSNGFPEPTKSGSIDGYVTMGIMAAP